MKNALLLFVISCFTLLTACNEGLDPTMLYGTWQADQFLEKGEAKDIDLSRMKFMFNDQKVYTYHANLNSQEAGHYRIKGNFLYTTDTLDSESLEKVVQISHITADSLHITMNRGGTEQVIILHKTK